MFLFSHKTETPKYFSPTTAAIIACAILCNPMDSSARSYHEPFFAKHEPGKLVEVNDNAHLEKFLKSNYSARRPQALTVPPKPLSAEPSASIDPLNSSKVLAKNNISTDGKDWDLNTTASDFDTTLNPNELLPITREPPLSSDEELIVGFRLLGPENRRLLSMEAMEILLTKSGERLWPIFSLALAIGEEPEILTSNAYGPVEFAIFPTGGKKAIISIPDATVRFGLEVVTAEIRQRWSEFTRGVEVYISESVMAKILGYRVEWDEMMFEIIAQTDTIPQWYLDKKKTKRIDLSGIQEIPQNLPSVLPPAEPPENGIEFIEAALSGSYSATNDLKDKQSQINRPRERIWGRLGGGAFRFDLSQKELYNSTDRSSHEPDFMIDRAWWRLENDARSITLGDSDMSLGEILFPQTGFTGIRWTQSNGPDTRGLFRPETTIIETAPLDSQVDLYVNDQLVEAQRVRDPLKAEPGFGTVRFEGIALIPGRENKIRLIITEPSGYRREVVKSIWGSNKVLSPGKYSLIAGAGTSRSKGEWENHGIFSGGLLRLGISDSLTAEGSAGWQKHFLPRTVWGNEEADYSLPEESLHAGFGVSWQPYKKSFIKGDVAHSWDAKGNKEDWAARIRGDFQLGKASINPDLFHYGSEYFDGTSANLSDRQGLWLGMRIPVTTGFSLSGSGGAIRDNLDGNNATTLSETIGNLRGTFSGWIPGTRLSLAASRINQHWEKGENFSLYSTEAIANPTRRIQLEGRIHDGDKIATWDHQQLVGSARLANLPFYVNSYRGARASWTISQNVSASLAHWDYITREESQFNLSLRGQGKRWWDMESELGKEWDEDAETLIETLIWKGRLNLYPFGEANRRLSMQTSLRQEEWSFVGYFNILEILGFDGINPMLMSNKANPAAGSVLGKVFLDKNGDGRCQDDEQGVPGINIAMGKNRLESDDEGRFFLSRSCNEKDCRVEIDLLNLDAIYVPTNGTQIVHFGAAASTRAYLGIAIMGIITGKVELVGDENSNTPLQGMAVGLYDSDGSKVGSSLTASDGSYYLGEVKPGTYWIKVEKESQDASMVNATPPQKITVVSGEELPLEQKVNFLMEKRLETDKYIETEAFTPHGSPSEEGSNPRFLRRI